MKKRIVVVNDKMQKGYRYVLSSARPAASSIRSSSPN